MSMHDFIIIDFDFLGVDLFLREVLAANKQYNSKSLRPLLRDAFGKHLFFGNADALERAGFGSLSVAQAFYNSYYWFLIFAKLYQAENGYDAGVEQQSFKLVERMPPDGDWKIVEEIAEAVNQGWS